MEIFFLAALGTLAVGWVLRPVFRITETSKTIAAPAGEWEQLAEQKERHLAALKDLEFEYKTGKLSTSDYERVKADDMAHLARIMARMDELGPTGEPKPPEAQKTTCSSCGKENPRGAKFCLHCGKPFEILVKCPGCGTMLPEEARFCINCGTDVRG